MPRCPKAHFKTQCPSPACEPSGCQSSKHFPNSALSGNKTIRQPGPTVRSFERWSSLSPRPGSSNSNHHHLHEFPKASAEPSRTYCSSVVLSAVRLCHGQGCVSSAVTPRPWARRCSPHQSGFSPRAPRPQSFCGPIKIRASCLFEASKRASDQPLITSGATSRLLVKH